MAQARHRRANTVPIILWETLHGFDHFCSRGAQIFSCGSPLLLHMWLQEHFHDVKPLTGVMYNPRAYGLRSLREDARKNEQEWLEFLANYAANDIVWMPPQWRLKRFMIYSTSQLHILLPSLHRSSFYFGDRISRQFGRAQYIGPLSQRIHGYWNCSLKARMVDAGNPPESINLSKEYLT